LRWEKNENDTVKVDLVTLGNLLDMVNFNERWIYKGSVTTPPCGTFVYWNVLSTIYPIKQEHLDLFVNKQLTKVHNLDKLGNWREVQKIDEHKLYYLKNEPRQDYKDKELSKANRKVIIFIVLFCVAGAIADIFIFLWC